MDRIDRRRVRLTWDGRPEAIAGPPFELAEDDERLLEVTTDPHVDRLVVRDGSEVLLAGLYLGAGHPRSLAGDHVPGPPPDLCRQLLESAEGALPGE